MTLFVFLVVLGAALLHAVWNAAVKGSDDKTVGMLAVMAGHIPPALLCLVFFAPPSLESLHNCRRETYFRYRLDQRPTAYPPPRLTLVDVRNSRFEFGCAAPTFARIESHLQNDGQVLI